ncbi:MAG: hypothetical protein IPM02_21750 [Betaproteobacteria bacterium]|nr:hypothetical protein [Betaproteobacteria bacterium]
MKSFIRPLAACGAFIMFLATSGLGHAGNNHWSWIGPFGGNISSLKFDPANPSNALAVAFSGVIYSRDGGSTWNDAYYQGRRLLANVIAVGPARYYIVTQQSELLSSTDGGLNWSGAHLPNVVAQLQVDAQDNRTVYARIETGPGTFGSVHGIFRSGDAGATWTAITPPSGLATTYDLIAGPVRGGLVYAGVRGDVLPLEHAYYKSDDGGASWTRLEFTLPAGALATLSVDPTRPDTLYITRLADGRHTINLARSTDGGLSWNVSATNLQAGLNDAYVVIPDPFIHDTLYIGTGSGFAISRSTDGGTVWSQFSAGTTPYVRNGGTVVPHPTQPGRLFAATYNGLFSTDDGATWQEITNGYSGRSISGMAIDEPRIVVASTQNDLQFFETTDAMHWIEIAAPDSPFGASPYSSLPSIGAPPWSAHRYALAPAGNQLRLKPGDVDESRLFRSDDDGATWTSVTISGSEVPDYLLAINNDNPPHLFGSYYVYTCTRSCNPTSSVLVRSTDGGVSWQKLGGLPSPASVISVAVSQAQPATILVAQSTGFVNQPSGISRSTDGGASFQPVPFTETINGILYADPHHPQVFYSATQSFSTPSRLYRSADGGLTWSAVALDVALSQATGSISDLAFSATRPDRVDMVANNGLLQRSEDAGLTWKGLSPGPGEGLGSPRFGRHEPRTVYFTSNGHGIAAYTIARDRAVNVVEFYNSGLDHYFLTAAAEEAQGIDRGAAGPGWSRTGLGFQAWLTPTAAPPDARPVCRFYGTPGIGPNSHFYTIDPAECAGVQNDPGWQLEATDVFYLVPPANGACAQGRQAVLRAYNNRYAQNDSNHRYATDPVAYNQVLARGWLGENVVMCAAQ